MPAVSMRGLSSTAEETQLTSLTVDSPYEQTSGAGLQTHAAECDARGAVTALRQSRAAQLLWRADHTLAERQAVVTKFGQLLRRDADRLAERISRQMGKPVSQALGEVWMCVCFIVYVLFFLVRSGCVWNWVWLCLWFIV
jgi:acyl-CoA reductase-like NAD-dependent aldehyde dehydrogenase